MIDLVLLFMIVLIPLYERSIASRRHTGTPSDHFDGKKFFNPALPVYEAEAKRRSVWLWLLTHTRGAWKKKDVTPSVPPERVHDGMRVTFINHATVLIQCAGLNIITDPVWSRRASPFSFLGPARYAAPGVRFEDLPPIDIVLLSHNHYDHMDLATLRRLDAAFKPRIYTSLGNAAYLARKGIAGARDMDWWNQTTDESLTIACVPAQHFSARSVSDRNRTLWCGFLLEAGSQRIYFSGDTGFGPFVHEIAAKYAPLTLALLPIGAYDPQWMMRLMHTNPEEAIRMHDILQAQHSVGIHFGTFRLTDEPQDEPAQRLAAQRGERDFRALENGGTVLIKGGFSKNS